MHKKTIYRILTMGLRLGLGLIASMAVAHAQQYTPTTPTENDLYCSGVITDQQIPNDSYVISGENSYYKTTFFSTDYVFINRGSSQGVKVGDQFDVIRPISDMMDTVVWFKYQAMLARAMGTRYADIGRLRVIHVDEKTSTAQIVIGCEPIQRDDTVLPFQARLAPQFHDVKLDPFAPPSGKKTAMIVNAKDYAVVGAAGRIVYVNLGSAQGVRVGDYFRVFRYQNTHINSVYELHDTAWKAYGFGSTPVAYEWNNLPRQVLGEGIVLRLGTNSSTVMLTDVRWEIYTGDYVEVE
jgi:hypothetical protein